MWRITFPWDREGEGEGDGEQRERKLAAKESSMKDVRMSGEGLDGLDGSLSS